MYLMFMGPFTDGGDWSDTGIKGISRFVQRVWKTLTEKTKANIQEDAELQTKLHKTIQTVTNGLERLLFNTSIASLMELLNAMEKREAISKEMAQTFTLLLSPLAPHLAEELWESLGCRGFVVEQQWPIFDPALLKAKTLTIMVQVNGKIRGQLEVDAEASKEDILAAAKQNENVKKYLTGPVKKEIYVPGKLVSLVL